MYTNEEIERAWANFRKVVKLGKNPPDYEEMWKNFAKEQLRLKYKVSKKDAKKKLGTHLYYENNN